jgi:hypothetical protein
MGDLAQAQTATPAAEPAALQRAGVSAARTALPPDVHDCLGGFGLLRRFAAVRCAASLAFAGVLSFAPGVAGVATALTFTFVFPFTRMLPFFGFGQSPARDAGVVRGAGGIGLDGERTSY